MVQWIEKWSNINLTVSCLFTMLVNSIFCIVHIHTHTHGDNMFTVKHSILFLLPKYKWIVFPTPLSIYIHPQLPPLTPPPKNGLCEQMKKKFILLKKGTFSASIHKHGINISQSVSSSIFAMNLIQYPIQEVDPKGEWKTSEKATDREKISLNSGKSILCYNFN